MRLTSIWIFLSICTIELNNIDRKYGSYHEQTRQHIGIWFLWLDFFLWHHLMIILQNNIDIMHHIQTLLLYQKQALAWQGGFFCPFIYYGEAKTQILVLIWLVIIRECAFKNIVLSLHNSWLWFWYLKKLKMTIFCWWSNSVRKAFSMLVQCCKVFTSSTKQK